MKLTKKSQSWKWIGNGGSVFKSTIWKRWRRFHPKSVIFNIVFRFKVRKNIFQKLFLTGIQNGDVRRDRAKKWNFKWYFLKTKQQFKKFFYQMSCMKDKYSIYAKKLSPLFPKSYFLDFPWWCCFPSGKTTPPWRNLENKTLDISK